MSSRSGELMYFCLALMTTLQRMCTGTQKVTKMGAKRHYLCVMFHLSQLHLFIPLPVSPVIKVHRQPHWLQEEARRVSGQEGNRSMQKSMAVCTEACLGKANGSSLPNSTPLTNPTFRLTRHDHHP